MSIRYDLFSGQRDLLLLAARTALLILFAYFGTSYIRNHHALVSYLQSVHSPSPNTAAAIATVIEFFGSIALLLGFWTRPLALVFAIYTIATALIGHAFWRSESLAQQHADFVHFLKNLSIAAGFILLVVTGPGRLSIDRR